MDLSAWCSNNYGWSQEDALTVIDLAERAGVMCLGGDVVTAADGVCRVSGDNWYHNSTSYLPSGDDIAQGATKARDYISSYPTDGHQSGVRVVFEIVFFDATWC